MSVIEAAMDTARKLAGRLRDALSPFKAELQTLIEQLAAAEAAIVANQSDSAPRPELERNIRVLVDQLKDSTKKALAPILPRAAGGRFEVLPGAEEGTLIAPTLPELLHTMPAAALIAVADSEALTKALIDALPANLPEGVPMAERPAHHRKLLANLQSGRRMHAELADAAAEAGIVVPHLPENIARRSAAARRRETWETDGRLNADYYRRFPDRRPPEPAA